MGSKNTMSWVKTFFSNHSNSFGSIFFRHSTIPSVTDFTLIM